MFDYDAFLRRNDRAALMFSGGRDSLALLEHAKDYLGRMTVLWVNSGDAFPETLEQMRRVRKAVPHFVEVAGDQPGVVRRYGPPSDLVDVWATPFGKLIEDSNPHSMIPAWECCNLTLWQPAWTFLRRNGYNGVLRGQRQDEFHKARIMSGMLQDGIEVGFPIEDWTEAETLQFLKDRGIELPTNYDWFHSSADCMTCTGYLAQNEGKIGYLKEYHPEAAKIVRVRLQQLHAAGNARMNVLEQRLGE